MRRTEQGWGGRLYLIRIKGALLGQEKGAIKRKLRYVIEIMGCLKCVPCLRSSIVHPLSNSLTSSLIRCCRNYPSISQACSCNIFLVRRSSYIADRAVVCSRMRHATKHLLVLRCDLSTQRTLLHAHYVIMLVALPKHDRARHIARSRPPPCRQNSNLPPPEIPHLPRPAPRRNVIFSP